MLHHPHADVIHVLASQQRVGVVDSAGHQPGTQSQAKLSRNQPPEVMLDRLMDSDVVNSIDDELRYPEQGRG